VTGFGLLGHLREMLVASGLSARLDPTRVPVIDGVRDLLAAGMVAGGTQRNHAFVDPDVDWAGLSSDEQLLLADAQTSGGLLLAVDPSRAGALVAALGRRGTPAAAVIGHTVEGTPGRIGIR
jgi:selenide,water dikinase